MQTKPNLTKLYKTLPNQITLPNHSKLNAIKAKHFILSQIIQDQKMNLIELVANIYNLLLLF